eukprot:CAMPEP_0174844006 /NCGR_PEP_ID=MMETSP1114-20130205/10858_1 /TAXON_ID=312471 /ORGANISM="Neobodo designis, Strain CCAP 1951/1" /LENGTH=175 /DNA_ID=CAMNT_0016078239 /DNA_START=39 /DNA_END=566 /DNA_ORIENTATION=+
MPVGLYVNDGSGRDSYVNGACLSDRKIKQGMNAPASFWPTPAQERRNHKLEGRAAGNFGLSLTLSSTDVSPARSFGQSPQSGRSPTSSLPAVMTARASYVSPKRELGFVSDAFSQRGTVTPRGTARTGPRGGAMETEAMYAQRTGRFALASQAPAASPRLPGLKLHQTVGVLDEV